VAQAAVLGRGRHGRQGRPDRHHPVDGHAGGAEITEVDGSHVIMVSQPQAVADVIVKAAEAVRTGQE
jgi:hypothetical protein